MMRYRFAILGMLFAACLLLGMSRFEVVSVARACRSPHLWTVVPRSYDLSSTAAGVPGIYETRSYSLQNFWSKGAREHRLFVVPAPQSSGVTNATSSSL